MPVNALAPAIRALNLSYNKIREVPLCVCSFTTLHFLDISENPDILTLPAEMGRLLNLGRLNLKGLKDLNDPPRNVQRDCRDCIRYLNSKLRCAKGFYRMKLMLVGLADRGKTTLVARLQGRDCGNESTVGVDVSEWVYRPSLGRKQFYFSIWDFGGQEEYYATHQCFLSQRSLYLLLFNLKHGEDGVNELKPWLNNIALRAPRSRIIIVGTHLDEVLDEERVQVDKVLQKVADLADTYRHKVEVMEVIPVGLKYRVENIGILKEAIYDHAEKYKTRGGQLIMGQKIPASYHALDKQLETVQVQVRSGIREPIMHSEEFKTMVQQMELADIQDDDELKTATLFLTDVGSLLHYDDRSHNLHELYFIDPRWLCDMMAKVVTIEQRNPFVKRGILHSQHIPLLFKDREFPWQFYEQYVTLLDRFEIALPLDNKRILIPSMLPDTRPSAVDEDQTWQGEPLYLRYVIFASADTPPGFWSRLLSRIMHSVSQIIFALDKATPHGLEDSEARHGDITLSSHGIPEPPEPTVTTPLSSTAPAALSPLSSPTEISNTISMSLGTPIPTSHLDDYEGSTSPDGQNSVMQISGPVVTKSTHQLELPPELLPNFPSSLPFQGLADTFDPSLISMEYWRNGLFYSDPNVLFRIEKLLDSKQSISRGNKDRDGVLIVTSPNNLGKKIMGQLVDLVVSLISEWYPGLQEGAGPSSGLEQRVPCCKCLKSGRQRPFEFKVEHCLTEIASKKTTMECRFEVHDPAKNHTVPLTEIVPDLLLQDINPEFLLKPEDLIYAEDDASLLGKGGYGKVYRGKYDGKPVAIKKYLTRSEDAFSELRSEAKLLQKSHHPCLVCLVGVCIHPMALVMEEAPMGSLEKPLIKKKMPVHRLTMYRMSAEVAAALRFLHQNGIIFRDLKAANVLLWTLNYKSLFHCKVTDFGIATHRLPAGAKGLIGTKGFIAPEVLYIGKRKQHSVYDHNADIFSFGMFLYQLIARRHPYHDIAPQRIDTAVEQGERPKFQDISQAETAYHYLTRLMMMCWEDNPRKRPPTDDIIKRLCSAPMQSVMSVHPVRSRFSLRHICAITPVDFTAAGVTRSSSELWVCCDGVEGAEVNIYTTNTMVKVCKNFIRENQVQCIALCGDHVWVGSRAGIDYGVIDIFSIGSRELVHNIRMRENSVSCITCSEKTVYLGTLEGYCFSFCRDIKQIQANAKPRYKYVSEHAVNGIISTHQCVWVSHTRYIYFLNPDNLALEGTLHRQQDAFVGQLSLSKDGNTVWSAHLGGILISAWDANEKVHKFDINVYQIISNVCEEKSEQDFVITAMCPALDTIWVGLASGHVMVFENEDFLTYYHPYNEHIRFLVCVPCSGPCEMEQAMVVSGAKGFRSPVPDMPEDIKYDKVDERGEPVGKAGILVLWESYDANTTRQIKLIEEHAPGLFDSHHTVKLMINQGEFLDGTHIMQKSRETAVSDLTTSSLSTDTQLSNDFSMSSVGTEAFGPSYDSREHTIQFSQGLTQDPLSLGLGDATGELNSPSPETEEPPKLVRPRARTTTIIHDIFDIQLPDSNTTVRASCPKPVTLKVLLSELQVNGDIPQEHCHVEYRLSDSGERIMIKSQKQLESYLKLENRPQLFLTKPGTS